MPQYALGKFMKNSKPNIVRQSAQKHRQYSRSESFLDGFRASVSAFGLYHLGLSDRRDAVALYPLASTGRTKLLGTTSYFGRTILMIELCPRTGEEVRGQRSDHERL
jgi:hypothetical protein